MKKGIKIGISILLALILLVVIGGIVAYNFWYKNSRYEYTYKSIDFYKEAKSVNFEGSHEFGEGALKYTSTFNGKITFNPEYEEEVSSLIGILGFRIPVDTKRVDSKDYYKTPDFLNTWTEGTLPQALKFPYEKIYNIIETMDFDMNTAVKVIGALSVFEQSETSSEFILSKDNLIPNDKIDGMINEAVPEILKSVLGEVKAKSNKTVIKFNKDDKLLKNIEITINVDIMGSEQKFIMKYRITDINGTESVVAP